MDYNRLTKKELIKTLEERDGLAARQGNVINRLEREKKELEAKQPVDRETIKNRKISELELALQEEREVTKVLLSALESFSNINADILSSIRIQANFAEGTLSNQTKEVTLEVTKLRQKYMQERTMSAKENKKG
jgi:hypothetical protein